MLWVSNGLKNEMMVFVTLLFGEINEFKMSQMYALGGMIGLLTSFFTENGNNILLTFILGFTGAVAAGMGKMFVSYVSNKLGLSKDKKNEDE